MMLIERGVPLISKLVELPRLRALRLVSQGYLPVKDLAKNNDQPRCFSRRAAANFRGGSSYRRRHDCFILPWAFSRHRTGD